MTARPVGSPDGSSHCGSSPTTTARARASQPAWRACVTIRSSRYGRSADFVEEQHVALRRRKRVGRAERRQQLRQGAAEQRAACLAAMQRLEPVGRELAHRLSAAQRAQERVAIVAGVAAPQPAGEHRPVKGDQPADDGEKREERREVAVADERLAGALRLGRIEQRQQLGAAVAAPHADEAGDRRIAPGGADRAGAQLGRARQIALPGEHRVVVDRLELQPANLVDAVRRTRSRLKALAGATTARRSPGASARGLRITRSGPSRRQSRGARRGRASAAAPWRSAAGSDA